MKGAAADQARRRMSTNVTGTNVGSTTSAALQPDQGDRTSSTNVGTNVGTASAAAGQVHVDDRHFSEHESTNVGTTHVTTRGAAAAEMSEAEEHQWRQDTTNVGIDSWFWNLIESEEYREAIESERYREAKRPLIERLVEEGIKARVLAQCDSGERGLNRAQTIMLIGDMVEAAELYSTSINETASANRAAEEEDEEEEKQSEVAVKVGNGKVKIE